jgi:hypothetical protein
VRLTKLIALLCCAAALLATTASPALASKKLGKGRYECYQFDPTSGYLYWGWVKVKGKRYKISAGKGKYKIKGKKIRWKSGPLKSYGWTGKYVSKKKFKILGDDGIEINCNR